MLTVRIKYLQLMYSRESETPIKPPHENAQVDNALLPELIRSPFEAHFKESD
jgi:hypothetical protein